MIKIENIYTHIKSFCTLLVIHISYSGRCCFRQERTGDYICVQGRRWDGVPAPTTVKTDKRATARGGPPEALQPKSLGEAASLVLFSIHHRRDCLCVLHDDSHFTVTLPQHASIIYVGRAYNGKQ